MLANVIPQSVSEKRLAENAVVAMSRPVQSIRCRTTAVPPLRSLGCNAVTAVQDTSPWALVSTQFLLPDNESDRELSRVLISVGLAPMGSQLTATIAAFSTLLARGPAIAKAMAGPRATVTVGRLGVVATHLSPHRDKPSLYHTSFLTPTSSSRG